MDCEEVRNELLNYQTGFLKRKKSAAIERHLEICCECREISASYHDVWQELGQLSVEVPQGLQQKVEAKVMKYISPPLPVPKPFPWRGISIAAVLLLLFGVWFYIEDTTIPSEAAHVHLQTRVPDEFSDKVRVMDMAKGLLKLTPDISVPRDTTLLGSKISQLDQMVVVQTIYEYQGIPISMFIWDNRWTKAHNGLPKTIDQPLSFCKRGQSVVIWERRTLIYCLVADLQPGELSALFGLPTDTKYSP